MNKLTDKELEKLLKTDIKAFNDYRDSFPNQKIDFRFSNLTEIDLRGAGANLSGIDLTGSLIYLADLKRANIEKAIIEKIAIIVTKENLEVILKELKYE